jgi:hypothetical protein
MALGLLTATADTGSAFLYINFFIFTWILSYQSAWLWACELIAHSPGLAHSHCPQWFFICSIFFCHLNFEVSISLILSMWTHSPWPRACLQPLPIPAVVFCTLNFLFSLEFWAINQLHYEHVSSLLIALGLLTATALGLLTATAHSGFLYIQVFLSLAFWGINQLVCKHVSSQLMALGLLTTTAGTGSGFLYIKFFILTWILSYQSAWLWAYELIAHGLGLAHSCCRYWQWFFVR